MRDFVFRTEERCEELSFEERREFESKDRTARALLTRLRGQIAGMNADHQGDWRAWISAGINVFESVIAGGIRSASEEPSGDEAFDRELCRSLLRAWSDLRNETSESPHSVEWALAVGAKIVEKYSHKIT